MSPKHTYCDPKRKSNNIVFHLSSTQEAPSVVPFELQSSISADAWNARISAIMDIASTYSQPLLERIWAVVAIITMIVAPVALYQIISAGMPVENGQRSPADIAKATGVSGAILVAVTLVFVVPVFVWKFMGRRRVNQLLAKWEETDRRKLGNANLPTWNVKTPGVFRNNTILTINIPPTNVTSTFHPDAYLPAYINGPIDTDATYYYPYKAEPGLPRMSVVGTVPLYS